MQAQIWDCAVRRSMMKAVPEGLEAHLHIVHAVLEGAVGLLALAKLDEGAADGHARRVVLVQEAAVVALHAQVLQPVRAHRLRPSTHHSAQYPAVSRPLQGKQQS